MVPSGLCFIMYTQLGWICLTRNCLASQEMIVVNVLLSRINVHSSAIAHFQWSRCGLFMGSVYVNGSLLMDVDARAFAMIISAFLEISTWRYVMRFVHGGWHDYFVMAAVRLAPSISRQRCRLWTMVSLYTIGVSTASGGGDLSPVLAGRPRRVSALGRLR